MGSFQGLSSDKLHTEVRLKMEPDSMLLNRTMTIDAANLSAPTGRRNLQTEVKRALEWAARAGSQNEQTGFSAPFVCLPLLPLPSIFVCVLLFYL